MKTQDTATDTTHETGPVDGGDYVVMQGECIESIAFEHGFYGESIWNDSQNAELKKVRKDHNILYPGDIIFIPDKEENHEHSNSGQRHPFRRKGVPAILRIRLLWHD